MKTLTSTVSRDHNQQHQVCQFENNKTLCSIILLKHHTFIGLYKSDDFLVGNVLADHFWGYIVFYVGI